MSLRKRIENAAFDYANADGDIEFKRCGWRFWFWIEAYVQYRIRLALTKLKSGKHHEMRAPAHKNGHM